MEVVFVPEVSFRF